MQFVETNWLLILIVAALAIAIAWYVLHAARRTRVTGQRRDVLDEGAAPAARNQALIDAPHASASVPMPPAAPAGLAGAGEAVQAAVEQQQVHTGQGGGDELTRLKGVGPKLAAQLRDLGVSSFSQIAAWSEADIDRIDGQLGRFQGRIRRDNWVEQARLLAAGDDAAYAARFGNIR
jgi:predicted flap endonuclease-1-like 5' DNA nuclease